jgi:hypothetical protein
VRRRALPGHRVTTTHRARSYSEVAKILLISQVHGSWSEADGYVAIPEGTYLHLFSEPGNVMINTQADWGAIASAESLNDLPAIIELFKQKAEEAVDEDKKKLDYWLENINFDEPGFVEQATEYNEKLKRSVANLEGQAELTLIGGDVIYDYKISSLGLGDQVFDKDKPGDEGIKRLRSAILGKVSDNDFMIASQEEKHLSDYLEEFKGWHIYWFACQYGAATKPDKETKDMLDETKIKQV